jgi:DsbC/DsbD-like thiol-disulfide interchange protein
LPRGVTAGPIVWPRPEGFVTHSIVGYGYRAGVVLLAAMKLPGRFPLDAISMEAAVSWLACSEVCVPGATTLKRTLPVSDAAATNDPAQARLFADARRRIPQRAPFETTFVMDDEQIRLRFPRAALSGIKQPSVAFYPFDSALIEHGAPQAMLLDSRRTELILRRSPVANDRIDTLDGLLVIGESLAGTAKSRAFDVFARRTNPAPDPSRAR